MTAERNPSGTLPPDFAEGEFDVRKLFLKGLVHVFLQIGRFDVLDNGRLQDGRTKRENMETIRRSINSDEFDCKQKPSKSNNHQ